MSDLKGPNNAGDQILKARWLTERLGVLHHLQVQQLEIWSYLCIPQANAGDLEIAADTEKNVIQVTITTKRRGPVNSRHLFAILRDNIQTLLGPSWDLVVVRAGKILFGVVRTDDEKKAVVPPVLRQS